jgi:curli production assembly/transport component CsgE
LFCPILNNSILTAQTDSVRTIKSDEIEVSGLVIDETITKLGKDFYDLVYSKWESIAPPSNLSVFISEKPMPSLGSQISIKVDDNLIFQQVIRPNEETLNELSDYAVSVLNDYFTNYEQIQKDLTGDDLKGTGIY